MSSEYVDAGGRGRRGVFRHQDGRDVQCGRARNQTLPQGNVLQVQFVLMTVHRLEIESS